MIYVSLRRFSDFFSCEAYGPHVRATQAQYRMRVSDMCVYVSKFLTRVRHGHVHQNHEFMLIRLFLLFIVFLPMIYHLMITLRSWPRPGSAGYVIFIIFMALWTLRAVYIYLVNEIEHWYHYLFLKTLFCEIVHG